MTTAVTTTARRAARTLQGTVARQSLTGAGWTAFSRATGFVRVAVIAAVLGPTYFGNLFQTANLVPNLTFELVAGTLVAPMLVPALVRAGAGRIAATHHPTDAGDGGTTRGRHRRAEEVAGGFLGVLLTVTIGATVLFVLGAPLLARLIGAGIADADLRRAQIDAGWLLIALVVPQLSGYAVVAVGGAVQHARGSFGLTAAAPAIENLGVVVTLLVVAVRFGTGNEVDTVGVGQVLVLGIGSTAAVGLHAVLQYAGARRVGVRLRPRSGWRDPEVRRVVRLAVPSSGVAVLGALRMFALLVAASSVPGGAVALTIALAFANLPVALVAKPVTNALLPRLARSAQAGDQAALRHDHRKGVRTVLLLLAPASAAYVLLARPLAGLVTFGPMSEAGAVTLVAVTLAAIALGPIGDGWFLMGLQTAFARRDPRGPLAAAALRAGLTAGGLAAAMTVDGTARLAAIGLTVSVSDLTAAGLLDRRIARQLRRTAGLPA